MLEKLVAIDIETTPIDTYTKDIDKIWCICMAWYAEDTKKKKEIATQSIVFPEGITKEELVTSKREELPVLQGILDNNVDVRPVFHNALFEYKHLTESGFRLGKFHDSQVLGYVLCPALKRFSLKAWGERGYCDEKEHADVDVDKFFSTFSEEIVERCISDVKNTLMLADTLIKELKQDPAAYHIYENLDIPFIKVLSDLNSNGIHIDQDVLTEFTLDVEQRLEDSSNKIHEIVPAAPGSAKDRLNLILDDKLFEGKLPTEKDIGKFIYCGEKLKLDKSLGIERPYLSYRKIERFNPASSDQKIWALATYDSYVSSTVSEKTGKPKADKWALEDASNKGSKVADAIIDFQTYSKLYSTYCTTMQNSRDNQSRLHSEFTNTVTLTGRLSSRAPNFQNIPKRSEFGKKIRNCITAQTNESIIISIDLSAAELRILAWYLVKVLGDDTKYPDAWMFWNAFQRGEDPHAERMKLFDCDRGESKNLTFGTMYGIGGIKFAKMNKVAPERANQLIKVQKDRMPSIAELKKRVWNTARSRPDYTIHSLYGRRFTYPDIISKDGQKRSRAERQMFNALIQGTQGDIMKVLMLEAAPYIQEAGGMMIMQIHDELVVECPIGTATWLSEKLEHVFTRTDLLPGMPLLGEAKTGKSLGECT